MGTIRETIDKSDNVVAAQDYYSYGEYIRSYNQGLSNDRYKFTGKERDNETNLDYFGARYYESSSGRWLSADPLADDHPEESPYVYCSDNPVNIVDDDGMDDAPSNTGNPHEYILPTIIVIAQAVPIPVPFYGPLPIPIPSPQNINTANKNGQAVNDFLSRLNNLNNEVKLGVMVLITKAIESVIPTQFNEEKKSSGEPASEKTAVSIAKQIEKDLGKEARREFHDMKEGRDRTLQELKQDTDLLYKQAGKIAPKWLQPK